MKTPITDAAATLMMLALILLLGYLWMDYEQEKIRSSKQNNVPVKESSLQKLAPKSFEVLVKRTTE